MCYSWMMPVHKTEALAASWTTWNYSPRASLWRKRTKWRTNLWYQEHSDVVVVAAVVVEKEEGEEAVNLI